MICSCTKTEVPTEAELKEGTTSTVEEWPKSKDTITLILPSSPGGGTDTKGRIVQKYLQEHLGCNIIVENIVGGSHIVATEAVLNNYPKDMTVLLQQMEPYFTSGPIRGGNYDINDFTYIANIDTDPQGIFVLKSSKYETLSDLIEEMRNKSLSYSYLTGSFMAVGPEMLNEWLMETLIGIPYDGGAECATALLGGMLISMLRVFVPLWHTTARNSVCWVCLMMNGMKTILMLPPLMKYYLRLVIQGRQKHLTI